MMSANDDNGLHHLICDFKENALKYLFMLKSIVPVFCHPVASLYQVKEVCDIMIDNNKCTFDFYPIPGTKLLKLLEFPMIRTI